MRKAAKASFAENFSPITAHKPHFPALASLEIAKLESAKSAKNYHQKKFSVLKANAQNTNCSGQAVGTVVRVAMETAKSSPAAKNRAKLDKKNERLELEKLHCRLFQIERLSSPKSTLTVCSNRQFFLHFCKTFLSFSNCVRCDRS